VGIRGGRRDSPSPPGAAKRRPHGGASLVFNDNNERAASETRENSSNDNIYSTGKSGVSIDNSAHGVDIDNDRGTMSVMNGKTRYHHGNLRPALVEEARAILESEGVAAVTLRAVARAAGVSHAAPYRHFEKKEALLAAVAERGFAELGERLGAAAAREEASGPREALRAAGLAWVEFALERPALYRLLFGPELPDYSAHHALDRAARGVYDRLLSLARAGRETGAFAGGPPAQLAIHAWAALHGLSVLLADERLNLPDPALAGRLADASIRLLLDGVARPGVK